MCRKNGGVGPLSGWVVVSLVVLKLVLALPTTVLGLFVGVLTCIRFQGSFAKGLDVIEDGNVLVIVMMMIGFFFPWFIGPLVRLVFPSLRPYSHVACYPSQRVEKCARILACAYVFF